MEPSKSELRREAATARSALARVAGDIGDRLITSFASVVLLKPSRTVAGYHRFRDEADPLPILRFLFASGWTCALPVPVDGPEGLVFRTWEPGGELVTGRYSIPHPPETSPEVRPDVVLVPLLAYDGSGRRLGYGAGYYDRALANLRRTGHALAVGVAYAGQRVDLVPALDHDEPLDMVVTEQDALDFRKGAS
ncbi:MAG: 5-formyltetrahydrofolate cyclo-ligase [Sphingomonadales bacterium]